MRFMTIAAALGTSIAAPCMAQDDHADECNGATPITSGRPLEAAIEEAGDVDFLKFRAIAGRHYVVRTHHSSLGWWPEVALLAGDCATEVGRYADSGLIDYVAESDTDVFVRVRSAAEVRVNAGVVLLSMTDTGPAADDHGSTPATATLVELGGNAVEGRHDYWLDVDVFRVNTRPGGTYQFVVSTDSAVREQMQLQITDADGRALFTERWLGPSRDEAETLHIYVPSGASAEQAVRFLRIFRRWPGGTAPYGIAASEAHHNPALDDHADTCDGATAFKIGEWVDLAIEEPGDVDVLGFDVSAGHRYGFETDRYTERSSQVVSFFPILRDSSCEEVHNARQFSTPFRATSDGMVYVEIRPEPEPMLGSMQFRLIDLGVIEDDHADSVIGAEIVPADGSVATGTITDGVDRDVLVVDLAERTTYLLELRGRVYAELYGPDGGPRGGNGGGWNPAEWRSAYCYVPEGGSGRHSIVVGSSSDNTSWEVRLTPVRTYASIPDAGAGCEEPTPVALDTWIPVTLDSLDDLDTYTFPTIANHAYRVEFANQTNDRDSGFFHGCRGMYGCTNCSDHAIRAPDDTGLTIQFRSWFYAPTGAVEMRITDEGSRPDDHAEGPVGATPVDPDARFHAGELDAHGFDYDFFALRFVEPGRYVVLMSGTGKGSGINGSLYDTDGEGPIDGLYDANPNIFKEYDEREIIISPDQTGTYFFAVNGPGWSYPISYELQVRHACDVDFTRDGRADSADFFAYVQAFFEPWRADADFDRDGNVTSLDFFAFLDAFLAGCEG